MSKQSIEDIAIQWISEEYYQYKNKPLSTSVSNQYIKALLDIAGADGALTDVERKWILGYAAARGLLVFFSSNKTKYENLF